MPDAVSSATPKAGFSIETRLPEEHEELWVYFEVNNSTDFNETYRKDAEKESEFYSGGPWGSGQPALSYRAEVDLSGSAAGPGTELPSRLPFERIGHSSPDGNDGRIHEDMSGITTAREIVTSVVVMPRDGEAPRRSDL